MQISSALVLSILPLFYTTFFSSNLNEQLLFFCFQNRSQMDKVSSFPLQLHASNMKFKIHFHLDRHSISSLYFPTSLSTLLQIQGIEHDCTDMKVAELLSTA